MGLGTRTEGTHAASLNSVPHEMMSVMNVTMDYVMIRGRSMAIARLRTRRKSIDWTASLACNLALTSPRPLWARCAWIPVAPRSKG